MKTTKNNKIGIKERNSTKELWYQKEMKIQMIYTIITWGRYTFYRWSTWGLDRVRKLAYSGYFVEHILKFDKSCT